MLITTGWPAQRAQARLERGRAAARAAGWTGRAGAASGAGAPASSLLGGRQVEARRRTGRVAAGPPACVSPMTTTATRATAASSMQEPGASSHRVAYRRRASGRVCFNGRDSRAARSEGRSRATPRSTSSPRGSHSVVVCRSRRRSVFSRIIFACPWLSPRQWPIAATPLHFRGPRARRGVHPRAVPARGRGRRDRARAGQPAPRGARRRARRARRRARRCPSVAVAPQLVAAARARPAALRGRAAARRRHGALRPPGRRALGHADRAARRGRSATATATAARVVRRTSCRWRPPASPARSRR